VALLQGVEKPALVPRLRRTAGNRGASRGSVFRHSRVGPHGNGRCQPRIWGPKTGPPGESFGPFALPRLSWATRTKDHTGGGTAIGSSTGVVRGDVEGQLRPGPDEGRAGRPQGPYSSAFPVPAPRADFPGASHTWYGSFLAAGGGINKAVCARAGGGKGGTVGGTNPSRIPPKFPQGEADRAAGARIKVQRPKLEFAYPPPGLIFFGRRVKGTAGVEGIPWQWPLAGRAAHRRGCFGTEGPGDFPGPADIGPALAGFVASGALWNGRLVRPRWGTR